MVNMLKPNNSKTITDYAEDIFSAAIRKQITKFDRVDIIFDTYKKYSLKAATQKSEARELEEKLKITRNHQTTGMLFFE